MAERGRQQSRTGGRDQHFLRSSALAAELVRSAGVAPGELVLDIGAGTGALTSQLALRGARVIAVEIDPGLTASLRRLAGVRVLEVDALSLPFPREPFSVVANLPFGSTTELLRRLLSPDVPLRRADVIVQWELACKRAAIWPSTVLGVLWGAWHELAVVRRLPPCVFAPPPAVDAAVLRAVRREAPLVPSEHADCYADFVRRGFATGPRALCPPRTLKRLALELGFDPRARARDLCPRQWAALYRLADTPRGGR